MKQISDSDARAVVRTLRWAATKGEGTTADRERRRVASVLFKKLTRKWTQSKPTE